ncbi:MAG: hypothetical protein ACK5RO_06680 [Pseudobdellovibrionaceae bacterium]|nr:hypothetical protein [Pseudanabaena sp. M151S2SP2A07QC]
MKIKLKAPKLPSVRSLVGGGLLGMNNIGLLTSGLLGGQGKAPAGIDQSAWESLKTENERADAIKRANETNMVGTGFNQGALSGRDAGIQYDSQGRPMRNAYIGVTDAQGNLRNQFSMSDKIGPDVQLNNQGLDAIRSRALSTGPSAWAQLANEKQGMEEQQAMQNAQRQNQSSFRQGMSNLSGRGGLSAGARERMAMQSMRQQNTGNQGLLNQGIQNRMNIGLQDQQQKDQMLQQLPGMDMNAANFAQGQRAFRANAQQQDIGNALKDIGGYNAYRADAYGKAMQEWGTGKTADAQVAASRQPRQKFLGIF